MGYEHELYAERLRREAQAAALAAGETQWTDQLDRDVRVKLHLAWTDVIDHKAFQPYVEILEDSIGQRTLRSIAYSIKPGHMKPGSNAVNEHLLSLIEAEHEALSLLSGQDPGVPAPWLDEVLAAGPEKFRAKVNRIFEAHLTPLSLHQNSRLIEINSHEMHDAVVAPTLFLLHSQPRFAGAETAYQKALKELRNRDPADAITDAATALQDVLLALGCTGNALGPLLKSAKSKGLLKGSDTPLTQSISKTVDWVSATRGEGEAHTGDPDISMSDAWMVVHVVGALVIRLSEADQP